MAGAHDTELLTIETEAFSLYIKGRPFNHRFESLKHFRDKSQLDEQTMIVKCAGVPSEQVNIFDPVQETLVPLGSTTHHPIFFENEVYQLVISPKPGENLTFYHEHPQIRQAVAPVGHGNPSLLMGQLQFMNEVGLTTLEVHRDHDPILELTIELFPTKLDYKKDYQELLDEVSEEVYNLAFHFMKKTFLGASKITTDRPSPTEFYRLLMHYYERFLKSIAQIERQPHHELVKEYKKVRGDQLKRLDNRTKRYLQKRPQLFRRVDHGVQVGSQSYMPEKGFNVKKTLSYDTLENRFVKFMITRLIDRVQDLKMNVLRYQSNNPDADPTIVMELTKIKNRFNQILKQPFWRQIGKLDRSIMSLVMQMKAGYRDAYMIYLILLQGLSLQGQIFKMSVKDVATLYEYWTYLKMGQILHEHYVPVSQDIVKVKMNSLFVDLDQTKQAKRVFKHPDTDEKITLSFQHRHTAPTTVSQKPDIMLEIEKKDHPYSYFYIFDAKYRIDFGRPDSPFKSPGPVEEDINTMHRYRDAWVYKNNGPYERYAFGAYVLFPWMDEATYEDHAFYKSIDEVNIGGFPFLPKASDLLKQFVIHLIESNPEELQRQGILPVGSS